MCNLSDDLPIHIGSCEAACCNIVIRTPRRITFLNSKMKHIKTMNYIFQSINQSIQFWSGFIPVNGDGRIYPTLTAISPTPTPILHLARFNASSFFKPTLLLSFSTCIFHVFLGRPRIFISFQYSDTNLSLLPLPSLLMIFYGCNYMIFIFSYFSTKRFLENLLTFQTKFLRRSVCLIYLQLFL